MCFGNVLPIVGVFEKLQEIHVGIVTLIRLKPREDFIFTRWRVMGGKGFQLFAYCS